MTFSRSQNGISNYKHFYGAELVFFIEGNRDTTFESYDEKYYTNLIGTIIPGKKFKIKTVGNKLDVLNYHKAIKPNSTEFAWIDRDADGIHCSLLEIPNLIYTDGYSWENDFWSNSVIMETLESLDVPQEKLAIYLDLIRRSKNRLAKICLLDIALQTNGKTIFKKQGSSGIRFEFLSPYNPCKAEFNRLVKIFKENESPCKITRSTIFLASKIEPEKIIQGHLWETFVKNFIGNAYKSYTREKTAPLEMIKRVAFSQFKKNPKSHLPKSYQDYIKKKILNI